MRHRKLFSCCFVNQVAFLVVEFMGILHNETKSMTVTIPYLHHVGQKAFLKLSGESSQSCQQSSWDGSNLGRKSRLCIIPAEKHTAHGTDV